MRVSSPIGDLPFEPSALHVTQGRLQLEGSIGAWPARVEIEPRDITTVARLIPRPVLGCAIAVSLGWTAVHLSRRARRSTRGRTHTP
jgi:hypothetical protein